MIERFCFLFLLVSLSGFAQTLSGRLPADTTLDAASSPWTISSTVTVPDGITLSIEAGCIVYLAENAAIQVERGGCLKALGDSTQRICLTRLPDTDDRWAGISFEHSMENNIISYTDMTYGDAGGELILVDHSRLLLDFCTWNSTNKTIVEVEHPSLVIQHCLFPRVDEVEVIHGTYLRDDEYLILMGNTFGPPLGYNDVIDFTDCKLPGPIFQAYNNTFLGGGDDGLDLDGADAHIEGNVFMNFHKGHSGSSTSNAIATGVRNGKTSDITVVRNLFYDNDHAVLLKEKCWLHAENNTFVKSDSAVINFSEWPYRNVEPGKGAYLDGNIFWHYGQVFENWTAQPGQTDPTIIIHNSIIAEHLTDLGQGNFAADPQFVNPPEDFHLQATSPAKGAGPDGLDMGAYVPQGATVSGELPDTTTETSARFFVGGPGITHYRFALQSPKQWSEVFEIKEHPTIELRELQPGYSYTVYVQGRNVAGRWQTSPEFATSKTWHVVSSETSVEKAAARVEEFCVYPAYPNPFNATTQVRYAVPHRARISLLLFDARGRNVRTLFQGEQSTGRHRVRISADNLSTGVYYVELRSGNVRRRTRVLLIR